MANRSISFGPCEARAVAVIRAQVDPSALGHAVQAACGRVWSELRAQGVRGGGNIAIYHDDRITLDAGVEAEAAFTERQGVVRSATPAGLVATLRHVGPYDQLHLAHEAIHQWARQHGHRLAGPRWEVYGHWQPDWTTDPSLIETDVSYLVAEA